jgi:cytochrome bd-type quinol oxidase subunit 2
MESETLVIIVLYLIPMVLSMLVTYFDDDTETLGDFLRWSWVYLIPLINVVGSVCFFVIYLNKFWNRIKNIKIK